MDHSIKTSPIVQTRDGYFRHVDHANKLASTGFSTREAMAKNTKDLHTFESALSAMRDRYCELFPDK